MVSGCNTYSISFIKN